MIHLLVESRENESPKLPFVYIRRLAPAFQQGNSKASSRSNVMVVGGHAIDAVNFSLIAQDARPSKHDEFSSLAKP
jgi:hypothetical protein